MASLGHIAQDQMPMKYKSNYRGKVRGFIYKINLPWVELLVPGDLHSRLGWKENVLALNHQMVFGDWEKIPEA